MNIISNMRKITKCFIGYFCENKILYEYMLLKPISAQKRYIICLAMKRRIYLLYHDFIYSVSIHIYNLKIVFIPHEILAGCGYTFKLMQDKASQCMKSIQIFSVGRINFEIIHKVIKRQLP